MSFLTATGRAAKTLLFQTRNTWKKLGSVGEEFVELAGDKGVGTATARWKGEFHNELIDMGFAKFSKQGGLTGSLKREQYQQFRRAVDNDITPSDPLVAKLANDFRKWSDEKFDVYRSIAGGNVKEEQMQLGLFGEVNRKIKDSPIGYVDGYFPHMEHEEVLTAWYTDLEDLFNKAAMSFHKRGALKELEALTALKNRGFKGNVNNADLGDINTMVRQGMQNGDFNKWTAEALDELIHKKGMSPAVAAMALKSRSGANIFNPWSSFKMNRNLNLSGKFYVQDPVVAVDAYVNKLSKSLAIAEKFGPKKEKYYDLLKMARVLDGKAADEMERVMHYITGESEFFGKSQSWKTFTKWFTEFEVGTKIGWGMATIPNLMQAFISIVPKAGLLRTIQGAYMLLSKEGRTIAARSGVLSRKRAALSVLAGYPGDMIQHRGLNNLLMAPELSAAEKFKGAGRALFSYTVGVENPGMRLFSAVNQALNAISATTGDVYIRDLIKIARRGNVGKSRKAWAVRQLKDLGIDDVTKNITDSHRLDAVYRFATDAQLQKNIMSDPIWMNDPRFRVFGLFKRFGYRQAVYVKDHLIRGEISRGNVMPLLRLAAGGYLGGEFVIRAKNMVRTNLFNAPEMWGEEDRSFLMGILDRVSQVGSLGMFSDLARLRSGEFQEAVNSIARAGAFMLTPVMATEVFGIPGSHTRKGWVEFSLDLTARMDKLGETGELKKVGLKAARELAPVGAILYKQEITKARKSKGLAKALEAL